MIDRHVAEGLVAGEGNGYRIARKSRHDEDLTRTEKIAVLFKHAPLIAAARKAYRAHDQDDSAAQDDGELGVQISDAKMPRDGKIDAVERSVHQGDKGGI